MNLQLPWFLDLGTGQLIRKWLTIEVLGSGPRTQRLAVVGPGDRLLELDEIEEALDGGWDLLPVRMLHTLACAERALWLAESFSGLETRWAVNPVMPLLLHSHFAEIESFDNYAVYAPDQQAVLFEYVPADPWLSACLAHDVVVHEVCHAFLHGTKGWHDSSVETAALAEALGDVLAMVSAGRLVETRRFALAETGSALSGRSNVLSRFAELPGYASVIRDLSMTVDRQFVEAEFEDNTEARVYGLALVLSSALYEVLSQSFRGLQFEGVEESDALLIALEELAAVVFGVLWHLPTGSARLSDLAAAAVAAADPTLSALLQGQFEAQGIL